MKKIFILLAAAVAALSSCVEENALAPETKEGNVTIKAVSADSKTLLDGTDVVWENTDKIAVVLVDDQDVTTKDFSVKGEVNGANATFTGTIEPELEYTSAYAVYPLSAVVDGVVSHTLPEVQTGVVTSGMNLSSALLDVEQLQAGEAVGTFHNALVLLQVVVPAGMQEISLTSDEYLVGPTDFYVTNGVLSRKTVLESATVTLKTGSELTAGTHSLLVYPVKGGLTIYMKGTDGTEYTKAVSTPKFEASKYYTLDFTKIFNMQTTEVMAASPAGEDLVVPIVSVNDYTYSVSVEGNPDWITYTLPTKGFHGEEIVFNVKKNDSGIERSANVTISWGDESTRAFKITQKALFMDFVEDAEGNPIQWEETFGVYANESDATPVNTYKNIFTIELSDDFSKGTYKVNNMFVYNHAINGKSGGIYYADYVDGKFIVKDNDQSQYFFDGNITLEYDSTNKSFAVSNPIKFGQNVYSMDLPNKPGYIGDYTATVKVEEEPEIPEEGEGEDKGIVGTYSVTVGFKSNGTASTKTETITISENSDAKGQYKITGMFDQYGYGGGTYYANYADGILTVLAANADNTYIGSMTCGDIQMLHHGISFASTNGVKAGSYGYELTSYQAIPVDVTSGIIGTYTATVGFKSNGTASTKTETITISENSDAKGQYKITGMFDQYGYGGGTYYANYADGILTVLAANADNTYIGSMTCGDIQMVLSDISFKSVEGVKVGSYGYELTSYIAKRN